MKPFALRSGRRTGLTWRDSMRASPVAVWHSVAPQLSIAEGKSLSENARAFALLNIAIRPLTRR